VAHRVQVVLRALLELMEHKEVPVQVVQVAQVAHKEIREQQVQTDLKVQQVVPAHKVAKDHKVRSQELLHNKFLLLILRKQHRLLLAHYKYPAAQAWAVIYM
jgi:hypothetical protein